MRLLLSLALIILVFTTNSSQADEPVTPETIYLPHSMRAEGRITLTYTPDGQRTYPHHLAFTEVIDGPSKVSKVSIGYLAYPMREYYTGWNKTLVLDEEGKCGQVKANSFVPELDWFARMMYTDDEINQFFQVKSEQVGPSGFLWKIISSNKEPKTTHEGKSNYRNVDCHVVSFEFDRPKAKGVKVQLYIPDKSFFNETKVPMFSAKETVPIERVVVSGEGAKYGTSFTIDYFNIEPLELINNHFLEKIQNEFNLPLAKGCSEFLPKFQPYGWTQEHSFQMQFYQRLAMSHVTVAYDDQHKYLRKEFFDKSVSIWDLYEHQLYHMDSRGLTRIRSVETDTTVEVQPCSAMNVADDKLGSSVRPYNSSGNSIVMIDLVGGKNMAYMGHGRVRNMPCVIFEAILEEPPKIFGLNTETPYRTRGQFDYIVQFYSLRADANNQDFRPMTIPDENFWPARIMLHKRNKKTGQVTELDQLEVFDFHWGLMGWDKKASELFMAPQCFEQEDEQVRVELVISMDKYHLAAERKLIAHNKFKLENDLLTEISGLFRISRLHITELELSLRPHNVLASLVISDRKEEKKLAYYGEGELPNENSYARNRLVMLNVGEQSCISLASLIKDISLLVYCPSRDVNSDSTCTMVYGEASPSVRITRRPDMDAKDQAAQERPCQVYRFTGAEPPLSALIRWNEWAEKLAGHKFEFRAMKAGFIDERLMCTIDDFDVTRGLKLMTVNHYKYALGEPNNNNTRSFTTMTYNNVGDCAKVCSLDVDCRSYSYCSRTGSKATQSDDVCVLSSLDIRDENLDDKLVRSKPTDGNKVVVKTAEDTSYTLELNSKCNIHERDYLDMYTLTEETISLAPELAAQFRGQFTTFECAKLAVDIESRHPGHHVAMFAHCPRENRCLIDEEMFMKLKGNRSSGLPSNEDVIESNTELRTELQCQVYRRKYQTYFHLSPKVVERNPMYQLELNITAVEECARACWMRFGQICHSFDFCSPQHCTINIIPMEAFEDVIEQMTKKREYRTGCLHYERDLRLDKLRQEHLIGKHQVLDVQRLQVSKAGPPTWSRWFLDVFLFCLLVASFSVGLTVGHRVNDNLENVTILALRQSFSAGPANLARRASQALGSQFNFSRFTGESPLISGSDEFGSSGNGASNGYHEHNSSAIQMDELRRKDTIIEEEEGEEEDDRDEQIASAAPNSEQEPETAANVDPNQLNDDQEAGVADLLSI